MGCEWLWLEDEEDTVVDLREEVERQVAVQMFGQIPALTRRLRCLQSEAEKKHVGLILDVMVNGAHAITRPQGWVGDAAEAVFFTNHGYEAGLVYYEKMILGDEGRRRAVFDPPPPVVFLTVMHTDSIEIAGRLARIKERWAQLRGISVDSAKVRFIRKWDIDGAGLLALLKELGG